MKNTTIATWLRNLADDLERNPERQFDSATCAMVCVTADDEVIYSQKVGTGMPPGPDPPAS